jgi:homoserine kinase
LFAEALQDRLHEPYRAENAPLLRLVRERLPARALGVTLSGSGPTVIVWAQPNVASDCARELVDSFPDTRVVPMVVTQSGAGRME